VAGRCRRLSVWLASKILVGLTLTAFALIDAELWGHPHRAEWPLAVAATLQAFQEGGVTGSAAARWVLEFVGLAFAWAATRSWTGRRHAADRTLSRLKVET